MGTGESRIEISKHFADRSSLAQTGPWMICPGGLLWNPDYNYSWSMTGTTINTTTTAAASWSPAKRPLAWAILNGICFLASALVLVDIFVAQEDLAERPWARGGYLCWNFATTLVWWVEVTLIVADHLPAPLSWEHWIELLLVVYFVADSAHLLYKWKIRKQNFEEEIADVSVNMTIYLFVLVKGLHLYRQRRDFIPVQSEEGK
eukprot:scaffold2707_cov169-Amphora_coffeaeformis.AAC.14